MRVSVALALCCLCTLSFAADPAHASIRKTTNIPAEELGSALQTVAKDYDFQVLYRTEIVKDLRTQGAVGSLTSDEALGGVLKGTGLTYKYLDSNTVTIMPAPSGTAAAAADQAPSDSSNGGGKKSSQDFRVAQVDQGKGASATSVGNRTSNSQENLNSPSSNLSEIIVTAEKRDERLIDTPQSVSVLSSEYLSEIGATQFRDYANTIPGLSFQSAGPGYTQMSLRGITIGQDSGPTVGIYVDDVPYGTSTTFAEGSRLTLDSGLFDLDRIEVLRGPQGTLYGASTMGGLVKYVTKQPDTSAFSGDVQTGISDTGDGGGINYNVAAMVNAPIVIDELAVRASVFENHDGGYVDNIALDQKDVNRSNIYGGRLDTLFTPNTALSIRVTGFLQNIATDGFPLVDYTLAGSPVYGSLEQHRTVAESLDQQFRLGSATVGYDFGATMLTSISSYQTVQTGYIGDFNAVFLPTLRKLGLPFSSVALQDQSTTDKFTQEMRLASKNTQHFEWLVGGFFTHEASKRAQGYNLLNLAGQPTPNTVSSTEYPSTYEEYAAFGDLTWHLTKRFDVTGGVRYAENRQSFEQIGSGLFGKTAPTAYSSEGVATYLANARYHVSDDSTLYFRYATGYRPGGPNFVSVNPLTGKVIGLPTFGADRLQSYEGGFKAETSDRRFGVDLAGYYINWSNIQILISQNGFSAYANAPGGAAVRGGELTLTARPIDAFTVTGAFAYTDARLNTASTALGAYAGEPLPDVPPFTMALNADYKLPWGSLQPTVGATVKYMDARWTSFDKNTGFPQFLLPAFTTADLRAGVLINKVNLQLYVHNLTDERGLEGPRLALSPLSGPVEIAIIQPRTIGINVTTRF